jgi:hypothetical protein
MHLHFLQRPGPDKTAIEDLIEVERMLLEHPFGPLPPASILPPGERAKRQCEAENHSGPKAHPAIFI